MANKTPIDGGAYLKQAVKLGKELYSTLFWVIVSVATIAFINNGSTQ